MSSPQVAFSSTDWNKVIDPQMPDSPRFAKDASLHTRFYIKPMLMRALSEENKRPMYQDVEHVLIMVPGDKLSMVDRPVTEEDRGRFAEKYAKFKAGAGEQVVGTRLEGVPWISRSQAEEFKFFSIFTVEQLAEVSDQVGQKFPGFQQLKQKAQRWLELATGTDSRVAALEAQIAALTAQMNSAKEAVKPAK